MRVLSIGCAAVAVLVFGTLMIAATQLPAIGAGALLFPSRRAMTTPVPQGCVGREFSGVDVTLQGWQCSTTAARRGTVVYLHGVADNRGSSVGAIQRLVPHGFDVIAYDSRAHGASGGDRCTYGFYEKRDLQRVLDQLNVNDAIVIGHSLGAAVALQAVSIDARIRAVVAASTFSDLRTIATERAYGFPSWSLGPAFARAERDGAFCRRRREPAARGGEHQRSRTADSWQEPPAHAARAFTASLRLPEWPQEARHHQRRRPQRRLHPAVLEHD